MYENGNTVGSATPSQSQHSELEARINESNFIQVMIAEGILRSSSSAVNRDPQAPR